MVQGKQWMWLFVGVGTGTAHESVHWRHPLLECFGVGTCRCLPQPPCGAPCTPPREPNRGCPDAQQAGGTAVRVCVPGRENHPLAASGGRGGGSPWYSARTAPKSKLAFL